MTKFKSPFYRRLNPTSYNSVHCAGMILRFDSPTTGVVVNVDDVKSDEKTYEVGHFSSDWTKRNDKECWSLVKNGKKLDKTLTLA